MLCFSYIQPFSSLIKANALLQFILIPVSYQSLTEAAGCKLELLLYFNKSSLNKKKKTIFWWHSLPESYFIFSSQPCQTSDVLLSALTAVHASYRHIPHKPSTSTNDYDFLLAAESAWCTQSKKYNFCPSVHPFPVLKYLHVFSLPTLPWLTLFRSKRNKYKLTHMSD